MTDPPTGAATGWTLLGRALQLYAEEAPLEAALAPVLAAVEARAPGWRAFLFRRDDEDGPGLALGPEIGAEARAALDAATRSGLDGRAPAFAEAHAPLIAVGDGALVAPLTATDSHIVGVLGLARDAAEAVPPPRFEAEILSLARIAALMIEDRLSLAAARSRATLLEAVLDTVPDALVRIDAAGRVLGVNAAAQAMFGWNEAELAGRDVSVLMPEPHASRHGDYLRRYLQTGERRLENFRRRFEAVRRDGSVFPVEIAVAEAPCADGRGFIGLLRDVADRVEEEARTAALRDALDAAARLSAVGEMAASIAHEVNQPITAVGNYIDAACARLRAGAQPEELLELLERAREAAELGGEVVQRVRRLTQRGGPQRAPCDLSRVLESALVHLDPVARRMGATIVRRLPADLPEARLDAVQIQQVISNLVRNALDAVAGQPVRRVEVEAAVRDGAAEITVCDTGPGVEPACRERIFQSFVSDREGGVGLGLAVSRRIVAAHGGKIWVESGEAGGACFRVWLPLREETS